MLNRRHFLTLFASGAILPSTMTAAVKPAVRFLSCRTDENNQHYATVFTAGGEILWNIALPARGHAIQVSPDKHYAAIFARRHGLYLWVMDLDNYSIVQKVPPISGRLFYGHGVYSPDQSYLFVTENDFESGKGIIGVYDVRDQYKRVAELSSYGVGPHELKLLSDGSTLVIANGGIHTHPDYPRTKLNLATMKANLAYVDTKSGKILDKYELPTKWQQLSIRHLDVNSRDQVAIAMQHKGAAREQPPLVALHSGESVLSLLRAPDAIQKRMKNYCGSAAFVSSGDYFSISSPRGNLMTHWQNNGEYIGHSEQGDVCGLVSVANQMWASDGRGNLLAYQSNNLSKLAASFENSRWDNHLTAAL